MAAEELQQQCLPVGGHLVKVFQDEHAAVGGHCVRPETCCSNCDERPIACRAQSMQLRGDKSFAGAALALNRADMQVWNSTLHLLEEAADGWGSSNDGRMVRTGNGSLLSLRLAGEEDAGTTRRNSPVVVAGVMTVSSIGNDARKISKKETGVPLALPFQESEAAV